MSQTTQIRILVLALAMGLLLVALPAVAQQQPPPITIRGVVGSGFFHQSLNQSEFQTVPLWGRLNVNGFLGHPDFLTYFFSPSVGVGEQVPFEGFNFGNGFNTGFSLLRKRPLPLYFRYGKFFSPNQFRPTVSGSLVSKVKLLNWGLSTAARIPGLEPVRIEYEVNETSRETGANNPVFGRDDKTFRVATGADFLGWQLRTSFTDVDETRDTLSLSPTAVQTLRFDRDNTLGRVNVVSPLYGGTRIKARWDITRSASDFGDRIFQSDDNSGELNVDTNWSSRVGTSIFARRSRIDRETALPFVGPGPVPPGGSVLLSITTGNGIGAGTGVTFVPREGLRFSGTLARNETDTTTFLPTGSLDSASQATTGTTAVDFAQPVGGGNLRAFYAVSTNQFDRTADPLLGGSLSRNTLGQTANLGFSQPEVLGLSLADVRVFYSRQELDDAFGSLSNRMGVNFRAEKGYTDYLVAGSAGYDRTETEGSLLRDSRAVFYALHVRNTTWTVDYAHRQSEAKLASAAGPPLPGFADAKTTSDTVSAFIRALRQFPIRFQWLRGGTTLPGGGASRYMATQVGVQYRFRLLTMEAGLYNAESRQQGGLSTQNRTDVYFRATRDFTLF